MLKQTVEGIWKTFPYLHIHKFYAEKELQVYEYPNGHRTLNDKEKSQMEKGDFVYSHEYSDYLELHHPHENPNLKCDCGCENFKVCWWEYPYAGGFGKVVCVNCGKELILIDDYA